MKIRLRKIKLTNFKGIRELEIAFNQTTNIFGENAAGKTTVFDAFIWCLFGKDSTDRKDFEVKTLDADNKVIPQIDHEVECELNVENQVINVKRVLREKWVKRRGESVSEFAGNETVFFWNDVPLKLNEFQQKVSGIVDESIFKLITNPLYFNTNLKWQDRRVVLFSLADKVYDADILKSIEKPHNIDQVYNLTQLLNQGKTITEIKKELGAKKKKLKDELEFIPSRIDETQRSKPETKNWDEIEKSIEAGLHELADYNTKKENIVAASLQQNNAIIAKQTELNNLRLKAQKLHHELTADRNNEVLEIKSKIRQVQTEMEQAQQGNKRAQDLIVTLNNRIASHEQEISTLRLQWSEINARQLEISDDSTCCPACKQKLPDTDIAGITDQLTTNFNTQKAKDLQSNNEKGSSTKSEIESLKAQIEDLKKTIQQNHSTHEDCQVSLDNHNKRLEKLNNEQVVPTDEIKLLQKEINEFVIPESTPGNFTELNGLISAKQNEIDQLKNVLSSRDQITRIDNRITELQNQEGKMSQELADLENTEFLIDSFNKCKIDTMVESVNKKFSYVQFKLFSENINGGTEECCEALVHGVPFSDANNASKINAGLDVINTLCEFHQVFAPIFIDNRESVNELIPTQSQIINLIVSKDKTLKIA